jgi:hypothetical protein
MDVSRSRARVLGNDDPDADRGPKTDCSKWRDMPIQYLDNLPLRSNRQMKRGLRNCEEQSGSDADEAPGYHI